MSNSVPSYIRGSTSLLRAKLTALLPDLNTDLAASVVGGSPPVFQLVMGIPLDVPGPRLAISFRFYTGERIAQGEKIIKVTLDIFCITPQAGENTSAAFEMARQVSAEHVLMLLDDDTQMLTPEINGGAFGAVHAIESYRGPIVDLADSVAADRMTHLWGWQMPFTLNFSLQTR